MKGMNRGVPYVTARLYGSCSGTDEDDYSCKSLVDSVALRACTIASSLMSIAGSSL